MGKKKFLFLCLAVVLVACIVGVFFLHQHITTQRGLNYIIERQERLNAMYGMTFRGSFDPEVDGDPMGVPQIVIYFAGLRSIGFSRDEVEEIWMSSENVRARNAPNNHQDFKEVHDFLFQEMPEFEGSLNVVYRANFETLSAQFPDLGLQLYSSTSFLPLPVLNEVIRIWEAENPPQPRPAAELEP